MQDNIYKQTLICGGTNEFYTIVDKFGKRTLHRLDGPALITYNKNGQILSEAYIFNGDYHRLDGPAEIHYKENGDIQTEYHYINGVIYDEQSFKHKVKHMILG